MLHFGHILMVVMEAVMSMWIERYPSSWWQFDSNQGLQMTVIG